jgi:hypothetical protein
MTDYLKKDLESILSPLDLDSVYNSMRGDLDIDKSKKYQELFDEANELMLLALETWIARDLQEFYDVKIETPYNDGKVVIDLEAKLRGTLAPFREFTDGSVVIDWKTTMSIVDGDTWKNKVFRSWQWKKYALTRPEAKLFIYRGVSRNKYEPRSNNNYSRVKEVIIQIPGNLETAVEYQFEGVKAQIKALEKAEVWPQNTTSCWDFGVLCQEYNNCMSFSSPRAPIVYDKELSYSSMQLFLRCPEKFRLRELRKSGSTELTDDPEDTDNTIVGRMFHAGIAEVYKQLFHT